MSDAKSITEDRTTAPGRELSALWSTRLLLLAILGILFLTLFPFRFVLHAHIAPGRSPFLLGGWGKDTSAWGVFLNVLLFIPFGFAISDKLGKAGRSWPATVGLALVLGALSSYTIEFVQLYTVARDSGWEDVITNGSGSFLGSIVFVICGGAILSFLSKAEDFSEKLLVGSRAAAVIAIYFAAWFAASAFVQAQTHLGNWHPADLLVIGNNAAGDSNSAWKGDVFRLQFWNRALPSDIASELQSGQTVAGLQAGLLASYDFAGSGSVADQTNTLPSLSFRHGQPVKSAPSFVSLASGNWMSSQAPVPNLVTAIQRANQFTVRVLFRTPQVAFNDAPIVSLSQRRPNLADVEIAQQESSLLLLLRNRLSGRHIPFIWLERNTIAPNQLIDVLFTYNGADAALFVNGTPVHTYRLGPATPVALAYHDARAGALDLYACGYYFAIFFTGGAIAGIAARNIRSLALASLFAALATCIPALLLEWILVAVSGRPFSWVLAASSIAVGIAGVLWIDTGIQPASQTP